MICSINIQNFGHKQGQVQNQRSADTTGTAWDSTGVFPNDIPMPTDFWSNYELGIFGILKTFEHPRGFNDLRYISEYFNRFR